jgi:hypothetical protein
VDAEAGKIQNFLKKSVKNLPVEKTKFFRRHLARRIVHEAGLKAETGLMNMEWWAPCRVLLYSYRRKKAIAVMRTWSPLELGSRQVLLLRAADGAVFQVAGDVAKVTAKEGYYRVEVRMPWETALPLAALAKTAVKEGATTALHAYVARIKDIAPPPLKLVYEGYVPLRDTLIYKVLDTPPGRYFLEISFGGVPVLFPTKYYRHPRQDRRAGGDAGAFAVPLDALRTFHAWGLHELGADYDYVYVRIWRPNSSAPQQGG